MSGPEPRRRGRPRTLTLIAVVTGLAALALGWLRCGGRWGFGGGSGGGIGTGGGGGVGRGGGGGAGRGGGKGPSQSGPPAAPGGAAQPAPAARCRLRLDARGLSLDGKPVELAAAVTACKAAGAAELQVAGDARYGAFEEVERALGAAGITVYSEAGAP